MDKRLHFVLGVDGKKERKEWMVRKKNAYNSQYEVISLWINQSQEEARIKRRYGEIPLYFRGDTLYSGSSWPWAGRAVPWKKDTVLAKRITEDIYFMSKHKYRWCDCVKAPNIMWILKKRNKRVYFIEDFEDIKSNIESYRYSIKRIQKKLKRTRKYPHIYHEMLKEKIQEYNSYIKDFKLKVGKRNPNILDKKIATRLVSLKLRGLYDNNTQPWRGWWINKHWEDD